MNAKKTKRIIFNLILFSIFILILSGCRTTKVTEPGIISDNSRRFGQLESTAETIDRIINSNYERLEDITARSREVENSVERILYLYDEYVRENDRIINELIEERNRIEKILENSKNTNVNSNFDDSSKNSDNGTEG